MARARLPPDRFQVEAWAAIQTDLLRIARRFTARAFGMGTRKAVDELGVLGDLRDPRAQLFIQEFEYRSIRSLTAKTSILVHDELLASVREGEAVVDATKRLDRILEGRVATVHTIARTETNRAASWGRYSGWRKSGVVRGREAIATLDDRVREDHLAAHGEVALLDSPFTRGAAAGKLAPPWDPNCRCAIAPVTRLTNVKDGQVPEDAAKGEAFAEANDLGLAAPKHAIPHLIGEEDEHARALEKGWLAGRDRFVALVEEANR